MYISGASSYSSYSSQKTSVSIDSFISNFANESGGVMHVSVDAVSVCHSYFFNNTARFGGGGVLFLENSLAMHPLVIAPSLTTQLRIAVSWKQIHSTTTQ